MKQQKNFEEKKKVKVEKDLAFNRTQIKDSLTKHNSYITIDKIIRVKAFLKECNLHLNEAIGCSTYCVILKGYDSQKLRTVAVKVIINQNLEIKKELEDHIKVLKKINSEYVIKIFDQFYDEESNCFMIVMEYSQYGDLYSFFKDKKVLTQEEIICIFKHILFGIRDLHKNNIIHYDLKPQNILIVDNETIKISDSGLSKIIKNDKSFTDNKGGSQIFLSMEQMCGQARLESDYFSAGSILCFLSGLEIESDMMMMFQLKNGIFPDVINMKQKELIKIGFQMMKQDFSKRINPKVANSQLDQLESQTEQINSQNNPEEIKPQSNYDQKAKIYDDMNEYYLEIESRYIGICGDMQQDNNENIQQDVIYTMPYKENNTQQDVIYKMPYKVNNTMEQQQQQKTPSYKQLIKDLQALEIGKIEFSPKKIKLIFIVIIDEQKIKII